MCEVPEAVCAADEPPLDLFDANPPDWQPMQDNMLPPEPQPPLSQPSQRSQRSQRSQEPPEEAGTVQAGLLSDATFAPDQCRCFMLIQHAEQCTQHHAIWPRKQRTHAMVLCALQQKRRKRKRAPLARADKRVRQSTVRM